MTIGSFLFSAGFAGMVLNPGGYMKTAVSSLFLSFVLIMLTVSGFSVSVYIHGFSAAMGAPADLGDVMSRSVAQFMPRLSVTVLGKTVSGDGPGNSFEVPLALALSNARALGADRVLAGVYRQNPDGKTITVKVVVADTASSAVLLEKALTGAGDLDIFDLVDELIEISAGGLAGRQVLLARLKVSVRNIPGTNLVMVDGRTEAVFLPEGSFEERFPAENEMVLVITNTAGREIYRERFSLLPKEIKEVKLDPLAALDPDLEKKAFSRADILLSGWSFDNRQGMIELRGLSRIISDSNRRALYYRHALGWTDVAAGTLLNVIPGLGSYMMGDWTGGLITTGGLLAGYTLRRLEGQPDMSGGLGGMVFNIFYTANFFFPAVYVLIHNMRLSRSLELDSRPVLTFNAHPDRLGLTVSFAW